MRPSSVRQSYGQLAAMVATPSRCGNRRRSAGVKPVVGRDPIQGRVMRLEREEAEFRSFVASFSPTLLRTAYLLLHDRDAAEDATQSALLRTFRRWSRARSAAEAYNHRVLVNVCRNHWRHQQRHPIHATTDDQPVAAATVVAQEDRADQRLVIEEALAELPAQQREVLVLRFFVDLSVPETTQLLQIPEGTVKSATHRDLGALRKLLSDETQEVHHAH